MSDEVRFARGVAFIVAGVALIFFGVLLTVFGAQAADLEICSPPSSACQASLGVHEFIERFYSPGGLVFVIGVVCAGIGIVLSVRARRSIRR